MILEQIKKEYLEKISSYLSNSEYDAYLKSFDNEITHGMSANLNRLKKSKIDIDFLVKRFNLVNIYKNDNYAYYTYDKNELEKNSVFPGKDPLYHVGLYYIQEPSAARPLFNIDIKKSDKVLDLCASPGGKSVEALYNLDLKEGGFLVSNEIDIGRAKTLSSNIERMGFDNAIVTCNNSKELREVFYNCFDVVIVDAPCSGEGMFRKSEEARLQWSNSLVKSCASIQKQLLEDGYHMLKVGGKLVYSTCTFSKEEDEENVDFLQSNFKDMKLLTMKKIYPFLGMGEGQFYAIFEKEEFNDNSNIEIAFTDDKLFKKLKSLRKGIPLNDDVNGRIIPSHASTHNEEIVFDYVVDLDDSEVLMYLHGDVIRKSLDINGWCKITYKGLGLGLAKYSNGVLKNHYPKGLRLL